MNLTKRKLVLAGKNRVAIETLDALVSSSLFEISICPVEGDEGIDTWQPSLRKAAKSYGLPVVSLEECYLKKNLIFLSVEFDRIIKTKNFINTVLLNIHFSLLPAYKGCFTSIWPILNGESKSGVTLHLIDEGIDTGDILDQAEITITPEMTARDLYEKYMDSGRDLITRNLQRIYKDQFEHRRPQPAAESTYFSRKSLLEIGNQIKTRATARQIQNQTRALFFPEYQIAMLDEYRVAQCEITSTRSTEPAGRVLSEDGSSIRMATIDFDVILKLWLPGMEGR